MATGRTHIKYSRVYVDGYDVSGDTRSYGPLDCTTDEGIDDALTLDVKAVTLGQCAVTMGTLNAIFNNTDTTGINNALATSDVFRNVMITKGVQGVPANNDPVFSYRFNQIGYQSNPSMNPVTVTITFGNPDAASPILSYYPWGVLLLAKAAKTAANTATGLDQLAQSTKGGWMMWQVFAGDGTATIKLQDADTNVDGSFGDLLSSGVIDCSTPTSGVAALATSATVERYVRWNITLGSATTVTLALSWVRGL